MYLSIQNKQWSLLKTSLTLLCILPQLHKKSFSFEIYNYVGMWVHCEY